MFTLTSTDPEQKLIYVGAIDSYTLNNVNVTAELLEKITNEYDLPGRKLDFLCWTHPHDDHTKGMVNIIQKFCDNETLITMPHIFYMPNLPSEALNVVQHIQKVNKGRPVEKRSKLKFLDGEGILQIARVGGGRKNEMILEHFGPYANISSMQGDNIDWNKFSTSIMLTINGIRVYLAGDIEDMTIKTIEEFPDRINYIKIPHHTSLTSSRILELLIEPTEIACTTVYKDKLPNRDLLTKYIGTINDVFCTSEKIIKSKFKNNSGKFSRASKINSSLKDDEFGVVKVEIDVIEAQYKTYLAGDAVCVVC
ncbi:hypothetical protein [Bacillus toyonensis]|uniref:hypothetical protein n=1 Tax=Bacillus toyonensis TaxID=155322 RepID=UPI0011546F9A|nr:hypothetical protein [Bacillus toyonensis]